MSDESGLSSAAIGGPPRRLAPASDGGPPDDEVAVHVNMHISFDRSIHFQVEPPVCLQSWNTEPPDRTLVTSKQAQVWECDKYAPFCKSTEHGLEVRAGAAPVSMEHDYPCDTFGRTLR